MSCCSAQRRLGQLEHQVSAGFATPSSLELPMPPPPAPPPPPAVAGAVMASGVAATSPPPPPCPTDGKHEQQSWAALRARFQLEEGYTQLNHGSFGCCPTEVADTQVQLLRRAEANPDRWIGHHSHWRDCHVLPTLSLCRY